MEWMDGYSRVLNFVMNTGLYIGTSFSDDSSLSSSSSSPDDDDDDDESDPGG